jgi:hypothetical protein
MHFMTLRLPSLAVHAAYVVIALWGICSVGAAQAACADMQAQQSTVIYVWSPRMVGAVLEAHHAQQAAQLSGASFVPVLDPRVDAAEAATALEHHPDARRALKPILQTLCAGLLPEHALDHAPTMYVGAHGKLHPHRIIGIMPREAWRVAIAWRLQALTLSNGKHDAKQRIAIRVETVKP